MKNKKKSLRSKERRYVGLFCVAGPGRWVRAHAGKERRRARGGEAMSSVEDGTLRGKSAGYLYLERRARATTRPDWGLLGKGPV
jgi:hypothetical protein